MLRSLFLKCELLLLGGFKEVLIKANLYLSFHSSHPCFLTVMTNQHACKTPGHA